jgi:hypothetical protein
MLYFIEIIMLPVALQIKTSLNLVYIWYHGRYVRIMVTQHDFAEYIYKSVTFE